MNRKSFRFLTSWLGIAVLLVSILACNLTPATTASTPINAPSTAAVNNATETATAPAATSAGNSAATAAPVSTATVTNTPIAHVSTPGEPPSAALSALTDSNSSSTAALNRANGGDNYSANLYERPFSSTAMKYFPDLDITSTKLMRDATWIYINISLAGQNLAGGLLGDYGAELDLNMDGRGDLLVMAVKPGSAWSTDGLHVWADSNNDVGGAHPIFSDPPSNTNGYDTVVFNQGVGADPDTAWARISPSDSNSVQIAFKSSLIKDAGSFMWGAWAMDDSMLHPDWFDYNDHFTLAQAGSPLIEDTTNYPLKALAKVDNTCRWAVGFIPTGNEPGICPVPATPTPRPTPTKTPTATPVKPTGIAGTVYDNGINGGLVYAAGVSKPAANIAVTVRSGNCSSAGGTVASGTTNPNGDYGFFLSPGTYCVSAATLSSHQTSPQTVNVPAGTIVNKINFFFYQFLG
jgi:hypothetical protein